MKFPTPYWTFQHKNFQLHFPTTILAIGCMRGWPLIMKAKILFSSFLSIWFNRGYDNIVINQSSSLILRTFHPFYRKNRHYHLTSYSKPRIFCRLDFLCSWFYHLRWPSVWEASLLLEFLKGFRQTSSWKILIAMESFQIPVKCRISNLNLVWWTFPADFSILKFLYVSLS